MNMHEPTVSDRPGKKAALENFRSIFLCACVFAIVCTAFHLASKPKPVIDSDITRKKADVARKEWESRKAERLDVEIAQLKGLDISDLSKKAIGVLVNTRHPEHVLFKAIDDVAKETGEEIIRPPWKKTTRPENNKFWSIIYREKLDANHDWWIEKNTVFGQYRLIGNPNQRVYFSIKKEDKLRTVLANIIIGNTKPFYQVVHGDTVVTKDSCEAIPLSLAKEIFPETKNLIEGVYARHPCNTYALVPVAGFHANLAMDKATECVVILGKMGAKSVVVSCMENETSRLKSKVEGASMGYTATVNAGSAKMTKSNMGLKVVFSEKSHGNISPTLLENSIWHKSDTQLNGILESILNGAKPREWSYNEENQDDYNFDFQAAASILGIAETELRAEFEKLKQYHRKLDVIF